MQSSREHSAQDVLRTSNLHVQYLDTEVVRGVDLAIHASEKIGVVGESGSGKSTLALALLRLLPENGSISKGTIRVKGEDTTQYTERQLGHIRGRDIGFVAQDPLTALDPVKTIGYQLREAIRQGNSKLSKHETTAIAASLLTKVGVPDATAKLSQYPHQYSGGMRQRVCIAMAIAANPTLLIADEPTTALDVTTQAQVLELLDALVNDEKIAVLMISHDLGVISQFCDRVLVMYAGRIIESAPASEIFANPKHPYTRALIDSLPNRHTGSTDPLPFIPGTPPPMDTVTTGCAFAARCAFAEQQCFEVNPPIFAIAEVLGETSKHWAECHRIQEIDLLTEGSLT